MAFNPHTRSMPLFQLLNLAMHMYQDTVNDFNRSPGYRDCKIFRIICPILLVIDLVMMSVAGFEAYTIIFVALSFIIIEPILIVWITHVDRESTEMGKIYREADDAINGDTYAVADANQERLVQMTHDLHKYVGKIEEFSTVTGMIKNSARFYLILEISIILTATMQIISNLI